MLTMGYGGLSTLPLFTALIVMRYTISYLD